MYMPNCRSATRTRFFTLSIALWKNPSFKITPMEWGLTGGFVKVLLGLVIAVPLAFYLMQDRLVFQTRPLAEGARVLIGKRFASVGEIVLSAADGTRLHAWHLKGEPLVLYF